ncbi:MULTISPECIES: cytidine deaminase [Anaerolinea]|uniref:Cytidine deaminase n=1 Tax=Anaerolinea thermophila (strain DSM 14523 / JCM 11388 / NBRC 100420 / UNI-1) TaxID=926569 RepID=E8N383_ANATU|nr:MULTISPECIES: cytidine deaminase [Anaerolinea]BAJ62897.1 cytidine deaminase [Anaerolinea thermophila UNI-1]
MKLSDEQKQTLIQTALQARRWAYAPYSNYRVGAALLTDSGKIYDGVNVENAAYPVTMCAERTAVFKAVSEGERRFVAIAVATANGGTPCGSCRQVLAEFGLDIQVIVVDEQGTVHLETTVSDLLPGAFTSKQLPPQEP